MMAAKERPILFSAPMVRALLDGTKTQTRRIVKLPHENPLGEWKPIRIGGDFGGLTPSGETIPEEGGLTHTRTGDIIACPHGAPGDRLWVRETWRPLCEVGSWNVQIDYAADGATQYLYDGEFEAGDWIMPKAAARGNVSPLFMPRWASRLTLAITDVRVQRLQQISEADAKAEGAAEYARGAMGDPDAYAAFEQYAFLWESINGTGSWDANPWVWAISFEVVK